MCQIRSNEDLNAVWHKFSKEDYNFVAKHDHVLPKFVIKQIQIKLNNRDNHEGEDYRLHALDLDRLERQEKMDRQDRLYALTRILNRQNRRDQEDSGAGTSGTAINPKPG